MMGFLELERARRELQIYLDALEDEHRKIQVFRMELPLCNELVSRTIEGYRQQLFHKEISPVRCAEEVSSDGPVLEEFLPIKRCSPETAEREDQSDDDEDNRRVRRRRDEEDGEEITQKQKKKPDWLQSVQLWNPHPENEPTRPLTPEAKKACGSGIGNTTQTGTSAAPLPAAGSSTEDDGARAAAEARGHTCCPGTGKDKDGHKQDLSRKSRRCWAPELHSKFVQALQQLGGAHVATPKQIRELMKVDGLTNDEVKSHLQKYRLHTARPNPHKPSGRNSQIVIMGGTWVPQPPEYAAVDVAAQLKPLNMNVNRRSDHDMAAGGSNSDSPTSTSTSSHTITTTTGSPRS